MIAGTSVETVGLVSVMVPDPGFSGIPSQAPGQGLSGGDHSQALKDLLDHARAVAATADDAEEAAKLEQVTTILARILAAQQRQQHDLFKGKMPPSAMLRALA